MPRPLLKVLKWVGIVLGGLVGLVVVAFLIVVFMSAGRLNKSYDIQLATIAVPTGNEEAVERGRHLTVVTGICTECHGENFQGDIIADDALCCRVVASNLTAGKGGIGGSYSDSDFVRAIRHGVGPDGKPLLIMPSNFFNNYNDDDLGAIIAYLKSLPPVDSELPTTTVGPLGRLFVLLDP